MKMFYSIKRLLCLISLGLSCFAISAQITKPKARKKFVQLPHPGVDNQRQFDSLKKMLDQQRLSRKKLKNSAVRK